jgi:hypothetical protein
MQRKLLKLFAFMPLVLLLSCQKEVKFNFSTGKVSLLVTNIVGAQPLAFNAPYTTTSGEDFTVTKFKYYLSNISLIDSLGTAHAVPNSYFLVDQEMPASQSISIQADGASYQALRFLVGVDSLRNVSGAQTGALDPNMDMFWTWNSGYIMAKLEGSSSLSNLPNNRIEYHIGGFQGPYSALRTVTLGFDRPYTINATQSLNINLATDLQKWFSAVNDLPISINPTCTSPGALASQYADNYQRMFSITSTQVR